MYGVHKLQAIAEASHDLRMVTKGNRNRQIADQLALGEHTVKNYVSTIYHIVRVYQRA
ncbi:MAG: LuxR C-terminal-related transcriptional regulator [Chloroflexota bacterium]